LLALEIIKNVIYNVFATCKVVEGAAKGVIADLHRNKLYPVPLSLCHVLNFEGKLTVDEVIDQLGHEHRETILEYFDFLITNDIVFFNNEPELFPGLVDFWDEPFRITNSIIDFKVFDKSRVLSISNSIGKEPIKSIQFRFYCEVNLEQLCYVVSNVSPSGLNSIEIIVSKSSELSLKCLEELCLLFPRIFTVIVCGADEESYQSFGEGAMGQVFFVKENANSEKDCGQISPNYFTVNMKTHMEAIDHNSCLDRKLSVDSKGFIKNCPSMPTSFGHVYDTTFSDVLDASQTSKYWFLDKSLVQVCRDCEFRFVCTDCRAYVANPDDVYSKPLKCGYDPYTGKWSDWKLNEENKKAFKYYDFTESLATNV
jgi:SPASM domain peptide maturase of grasp-with-spasm system